MHGTASPCSDTPSPHAVMMPQVRFCRHIYGLSWVARAKRTCTVLTTHGTGSTNGRTHFSQEKLFPH